MATALLVVSTTAAVAQSEQSIAIESQQPAAVQGAQTGPSDELPPQMSEEQVIASARTAIQQAKEEATASGQHTRKLEKQLDKVAAELDNYQNGSANRMQEKKGISRVTSLPARMLAKKFLKKAEINSISDIKQQKAHKAAKALNTLATVGLVLALVGVVFLVLVNYGLGIVFLLVGLILLLVGLLQ